MTRWLVIGGSALALVLVIGAVAIFAGGQSAAADMPEVGTQAPEFSATAGNGDDVSLSQLTAENDAVAVVFYRGHF